MGIGYLVRQYQSNRIARSALAPANDEVGSGLFEGRR